VPLQTGCLSHGAARSTMMATMPVVQSCTQWRHSNHRLSGCADASWRDRSSRFPHRTAAITMVKMPGMQLLVSLFQLHIDPSRQSYSRQDLAD
jgi:hypothetical protein